jgi:hypothetical protein
MTLPLTDELPLDLGPIWDLFERAEAVEHAMSDGWCSCGGRPGMHTEDCLAKLRATCGHKGCGRTRTTGSPPGPWCCARCGVVLQPQLA